MTAKFRYQDYANAWNTHDVDRLLSFYADDVEILADAPQPIRGKAPLREAIERTLRAFPDANGDFTNVVESADGRRFAGIVRITGTQKGEWAFPTGGSFPATNKKVDYPMATFLEIGPEGKIVREQDVADMANVLRQLGVSAQALESAEKAGAGRTKEGASQTAR